MVCCLIASFLIAQFFAMLRRWGVFWGLVRPEQGEAAQTALALVRSWLARPRVRIAVTAVMAVEMAALGSWTYVAHGTHIYQEADRLVSAMHGERVVYAGYCEGDGRDRSVRIVLNDISHPSARIVRF